MRFIKRLCGFLIVLVVVLIAVAFVLPDHAHVERSVVIDRPASQIHALLNSFRRFNEWSPWAAKDVRAKYSYSGPESGVGAKFAWIGDPSTVGSGSQTIISSVAPQYVSLALDFGDRGQSAAKFTLTPDPKGTHVSWTLDSDLPLNPDRRFLWNLVGRYMGLFMDRLVGPDYEAGLERLKSLAASFPNVDIAGIEPSVEDVEPRPILFVSASTANDPDAAKTVLSAAYAAIAVVMKTNGISFRGAPLTLTTAFDGQTWTFDAAVPVDQNDVPVDTAVKAGTTPSGKVLRVIHTGSYQSITGTVEKAYAWIAVHGLTPRDRMMEEYITDPATTPVDQLQTLIRIPVK
ncbi:MAG: SRPBCC family protein [Tahibacter sp.]